MSEASKSIESETPAAVEGAAPCSALCIGGPKDGERMMLPEKYPYLRVSVKLGWRGIEVFEYKLVLVSQVKGLMLYADPKMTEEDIFCTLHNGYRPNVNRSDAPEA